VHSECTTVPDEASTATYVSNDDAFRSDSHLEVHVGNVETAGGGRQVFGAVAKADADISALICQSFQPTILK
jgi:hypothetical protein